MVISQLRDLIRDLEDARLDDAMPLHLSAMADRHIATAESAIRELAEFHGVSA